MENNIEKYLDIARNEGKTVKKIIKSAGIGRTSFYGIMSGKQVPKLDTAINIAKAFGVRTEDIFPQLKGVLKND